MLLEVVRTTGFKTLETIEQLGRTGRFALGIAGAVVRLPIRARRLANEMFDAGVLSLTIVCTSAVVVGGVLGLQGYNSLSLVGAEQSLGAAVGLTLIRELGPVMTGLLIAGRAGSAAAAEIATMVAKEQLDGLRMMSIDPIHFVVMPKAIALTIVTPLLTALFVVFGLAGAYIIGVMVLGLDGGLFLSSLEAIITFDEDVLQSGTKGLVFGILVGLVATFRGYSSAPTAEGVSAATTASVVVSSLCILVADYVITAFWGL